MVHDVTGRIGANLGAHVGVVPWKVLCNAEGREHSWPRQPRAEAVESSQDFIRRWRQESNKCRSHLTEEEQVKMCRNGIKPDIVFPMSENISTFLDLATEACAKERILTEKARQKEAKSSRPPRKDRANSSANVTDTKPKGTGQNNQVGSSGGRRQLPQKKYYFDERDIIPTFHQMVEMNMVELPEPKRQEEVGKTDDPKYCLYHRIINHPTIKCYVLKDIILWYIDKGDIAINRGEGIKPLQMPYLFMKLG